MKGHMADLPGVLALISMIVYFGLLLYVAIRSR